MRGQFQACSNHTQQTRLLCWTQPNIVFRVSRTQSAMAQAVGRQVRVQSRIILWDLWWTTWQWDGFVSQYYDFLLSVSFQKCSILIRLSTTNAKFMWQLTASFSTTLKNFRYVLVTGCLCHEARRLLSVLLRFWETAIAVTGMVSINRWNG